jgi:hypothetical protein
VARGKSNKRAKKVKPKSAGARAAKKRSARKAPSKKAASKKPSASLAKSKASKKAPRKKPAKAAVAKAKAGSAKKPAAKKPVKAPAKAKAAKAKAARIPAAKKPAKAPATKKAAVNKAPKSKAPKKATEAFGDHPSLAKLLSQLPPGRYADGTLIVTEPDLHHAEMARWLMGNVEGRVALGRTAFGDIVVFRDLRERAAARGLPGVDDACDVALIDLNLKKMTVLAWSVEAFLDELDDREFQETYLRRTLYDQVKARLGDYGDDEAYAFVPALGLGGGEKAEGVERANWEVYQEILFQV